MSSSATTWISPIGSRATWSQARARPGRARASRGSDRSGHCDLIIGGIAVTAERAERLLFSSSYMDETLAFIVPDHLRDEFADWETIQARTDLVLAGPNLPYYLDKVRALPRARIETFKEIEPAARRGADAHAIIGTAERGSTWTLLIRSSPSSCPSPGFQDPVGLSALARRRAMARLCRRMARPKAQGRYARRALSVLDPRPRRRTRRPRWSVIRDVLHWTN